MLGNLVLFVSRQWKVCIGLCVELFATNYSLTSVGSNVSKRETERGEIEKMKDEIILLV